jgi:hypothetical protein
MRSYTFSIPSNTILLEYSQPLLVIALMVGVYLLRIASENFTDHVFAADWPETFTAVNDNKAINARLFIVRI